MISCNWRRLTRQHRLKVFTGKVQLCDQLASALLNRASIDSHLFLRYHPPISQIAHYVISTRSEPHSYRPLSGQDIRLIQLLPGKGNDAIQCNINHVSLGDNVEYEALSYCWGDNRPEAEIYCDNGRLGVTKNLYSALCHLRHNDIRRTFWIDAICINQADIEERSSQVRMMKDIFQQSRQTVIWLGKESDDSNSALELLKSLAESSERAPQNGNHKSAWFRRLNNIPPLYNDVWRALSTLLQRPWFYRAWIVQEVSVSRHIQILCGTSIISWEDFIRAINYAVDLGIFFAHVTYQALTISGTRSQFLNGTRPALHNLLLQNRSFLASDARDKVFGLLSLANNNDVRLLGIEPDYHLSAEQVYKNLAVSLLHSRRDLDLFDAPRVLQNSKISSLPSWVPDWS
ncbi:HET-domain-containing protein, partial [Lepidopterella palustris CBS 459.81]